MSADDLYSVLSHPMRLRVRILIKRSEELCVCELTHALNLAQPVISRHLSQLKKAGLWVYYRINNALPEWTKRVIQTTIDHIAGLSSYKEDRRVLTTMKNSPNQACC